MICFENFFDVASFQLYTIHKFTYIEALCRQPSWGIIEIAARCCVRSGKCFCKNVGFWRSKFILRFS